MRGRPILELLLLLTVWCVLFFPLRAVTRSREVADSQTPAAEVSERAPVWISISFAEVPESFTLSSHGVVVWEESDPDVEQEQPLELTWDTHSQGDLVLEARWADARRRATEVRVSPPEGRALALTLWHETDTIEELLLFP